MDNSQLPISMDYAEFNLSNGASDFDVSSNVSALWDNIVVAKSLILETNKNITCKLNSTLFPAFPINFGDSKFQLPPKYILVNNLFLSNSSGEDSTLRIWLFG